jgi:CMP-N,N'-diacetyllegionaminic acid synthase
MNSLGKSLALIPARSGSKRVKAKNVRVLQGHPLLAYTLSAARTCGMFDSVVVSTDSEGVAGVARHYGGEVPFLRPEAFAGDLSPDIEWVQHALKTLADQGRKFDSFALLRPTSPFRTAETIKRAWALFQRFPEADSLRAVELCGQHPGKMWTLEGDWMKPLLSGGPKNPPWHSRPYQALPSVYVQNASLEIAWTHVPLTGGTIAGEKILPFLTEGLEGFDINQPEDWWLAEELLKRGQAVLPPVSQSPLEVVGP